MPAAKLTHVWEKDQHSYYTEEAGVDRALFRVETFDGPVVDPACGSGRIVRAAREAGHEATGMDVVRRGNECGWCCDFLRPNFDLRLTNVVCNPPFHLCGGADAPFIRQALTVTSGKVCMLLPLPWLAASGRVGWLRSSPLARIWILAPRPSMPPGAMIEAGYEPSGGRVDFCWLVWDMRLGRRARRRHVDWLAWK